MSLVLETQADGTEPIVISTVINSLLTVLHLGEAVLTVNASCDERDFGGKVLRKCCEMSKKIARKRGKFLMLQEASVNAIILDLSKVTLSACA